MLPFYYFWKGDIACTRHVQKVSVLRLSRPEGFFFNMLATLLCSLIPPSSTTRLIRRQYVENLRTVNTTKYAASSIISFGREKLWMHMGGKRFSTGEEVKGEVDEGVGGKLLQGRHKKINAPVHHRHWEEWWLLKNSLHMY